MQTTAQEILEAIEKGDRVAVSSYVNLRGVDLSSANLSGANLRGANLSGANLSCANLSGANLSCANLKVVVSSCANLRGINLRGANLSGANLSGANLSGANLCRTNLSGANLSGANLSGADLCSVDLSGAILSGAAPSADSIALIRQIAEIVLADHSKLEMGSVHQCKTTHCLAGWVCTLSPTAKLLESVLGWNAAACLTVPVPSFTRLFYASNEEAIAFLQGVKDGTITFDGVQE